MSFITVKGRVYVHIPSLLNVNVFHPVCYLFWKLKKKMDRRAGCFYSKKTEKAKKESMKLHTERS